MSLEMEKTEKMYLTIDGAGILRSFQRRAGPHQVYCMFRGAASEGRYVSRSLSKKF